MEIENHPKEKKHHLWIIMIMIFASILFFLIYTSFYNPNLTNRITGNVIRGSTTNLIEIDATLSSPEILSVKGDIEKIDLRSQKGNLVVGKESFDLNKASIVIDNFSGEISFNKNDITKLNGKASKVFIEGIPITSSSAIKIYFEEESEYSYLKLNNFYLNSLSYKTSGIVKLNNEKVTINLEDEIFKIEKFQGDLEIRGDEFKLRGLIKKSNLGFIDVRAVSSKENNNSEN